MFATLSDYRSEIDAHDCVANLAVLTSAVRDAANGPEFAARIRREFSLDAQVLAGEEEAQLTFLGAMHDRSSSTEPTVVVDIGGGSTEFIVGHDSVAGFHVSLPAGVVRMSERHISSDPPAPAQLQELARDVRRVFLEGLPPEQRGVGGRQSPTGSPSPAPPPRPPRSPRSSTPTTPPASRAIRSNSPPSNCCSRASPTWTKRGAAPVVGLHPDRAPTIVAGMILLAEALRAFELDCVEVSEHDILFGGALRLAGAG